MLLVPLAFAQDVVIRESLHSGSSATTVFGGTFTGAGWRVDDSNSRMYWDLGTQVERGEISVVIDDITMENLTLDNNHLIELFDSGGHWTASRAINLRVYGPVGGPHGDVKLKVWGDGIYTEARTGVLDWDGNPHLWTIYWDTSNCILYRDGIELVNLDVTGIDLRVGTLWLPLNDWIHDYSAPIGTTFSNLDLVAWEPREEPDPEPVDDGDPTTFTPLHDVGVAGWEDGVFSDTEDLPVDGAAEEFSYLMFDLSSLAGTVTRATLRVQARNAPSADGDGGTVHAVGDTSWDEDTLTWAARPELGSVLGTFGALAAGEGAEIDVTAGVAAGGRVAFALQGAGGNGVHLSSKEDDDGTAAAVLTVLTIPAEEGEEHDTDLADTGAPPTAEDTKDRRRRARPGAEAEAGCGCDAAGAPMGAWLLVLAALRRRRPV